MSDLIDRQAVIDAIEKHSCNTQRMIDAVELLPPVDAVPVVPVVRCRDCKWFNNIGCAIKIVDDSDRPSENDFCSFAERKTNE